MLDSSPFQLSGTAGPETRVEFGRFRGGRGFTATVQSFVFVPYNPVMESPRSFTVEAWLYLNDISRYELSSVAMRWRRWSLWTITTLWPLMARAIFRRNRFTVRRV